MRLVSFDAFRALELPGVTYIKPEHMFREHALIRQADWLLFPEFWQVDVLHYGLRKRIFPSLASYHIGHSKIGMTRLFEMLCPANTPFTQMLENTAQNRERVLDTMVFPFVAKKVRSSMGLGVYLVESRQDFQEYWKQVDVLYVQEYLPIDRDLRLVLIGKEVVAGYWRVQGNGFHNNVARGGQVVFDAIPQQARELVEWIAANTGIDHAGFDIAMVDGHCYLLEFNRLFGNSGLGELGVSPGKLIHEYLASLGGETDPSNPAGKLYPRLELSA